MRRSAIPTVRSPDVALNRFAEVVKTNLDAITGQQRNATALAPLDPATATAADCANQLNAILARLQGD